MPLIELLVAAADAFIVYLEARPLLRYRELRPAHHIDGNSSLWRGAILARVNGSFDDTRKLALEIAVTSHRQGAVLPAGPMIPNCAKWW